MYLLINALIGLSSARVRSAFSFISGWLTDNTGTYNVSFVASGVIICISGFLLLAAPVLRRCDHIAVSADNKSDEDIDKEASSGKMAATEQMPDTSLNSS